MDGEMTTALDSLRRKNKRYDLKTEKTERGLVTSILIIFPQGDGEMATSILLFFFRKWGDDHPTSWFKDKTTEILLQEAKERVRDGHLHSSLLL